MSDTLRWVIAVMAVLLIVGLVGYARGTEHHRGIDVGVHASGSPALGG
jgi:hypothetical protein